MCITSLHITPLHCKRVNYSQGRSVRVCSSSEGISEAERRLAALKAAQEASDRVVSWKPQPVARSNLSKYLDVKEDPDIGAAPRHVDIRMYDGAVPACHVHIPLSLPRPYADDECAVMNC